MIDIGAFLKTSIYLISSALLYPTMVLLLTSFVLIVLFAGGVCAEWLERARLKKCSAEGLPSMILSGKEATALPYRVKEYINRLKKLLELRQSDPVKCENLIQDTSLRIWKSTDKLRILVRIAPSLGLVGTLIPMGTGLAALGQGDMARLSSDLVIAFTTTVLGLTVGMAAFFMYTVKRRWIEEDIKNIELATEILLSRKEGSQP